MRLIATLSVNAVPGDLCPTELIAHVRSCRVISPLSRRPARLLSALTVAVSVLLVAGGLTATPAQAAYIPTTKAIFNNPSNPGAIFTELTNLFKNAKAGSIARIAIFELANVKEDINRDIVAKLWKTMDDARNRGVHVRIVHGDYTCGAEKCDPYPKKCGSETYSTGVNDAFGVPIRKRYPCNWTNPYRFPRRSSANADFSWEVSCTPRGDSMGVSYLGCVGGEDGIMHNKFATFTSVAGVNDITVISSQNWTTANYWESAVVVTKNAGLHAKFGRYFSDLALKRRNPDYYSSDRGKPTSYNNSGTTAAYPGTYRTYFFPKAGGKSNPVLDMLGQVDCRKDPALPPSHGYKGRTLVRVAMNNWTLPAIAEKLAKMDKAGCVVQVIYHPKQSRAVVNALQSTGSVQQWWKDPCSDSRFPVSVHSKYFAVSGRIAGAIKKVVFTGSLNFTSAWYRNDESMLRVANDDIYQAFYNNFSNIANAGGWKTGPVLKCARK